MSIDPRDTVEKAGTNPNRGMNTKSYMMILAVAAVAIIVILLVAILGSHSKGRPGPTTPPTSSGQNSPTPQ